ncbi:hypothetical protein IW261DRAFT_568934 [Armillaria novae-zelandiae]|uniref:Uncharacterized protein n=1 Tax=Armillaria novae-zelandiae TaxID=153914 RepID=A0AA39NZ35_9AGAR|nr:hypothetical protein IW261DRAFT_568934 [Armillaria novae-zelandiae]
MADRLAVCVLLSVICAVYKNPVTTAITSLSAVSSYVHTMSLCLSVYYGKPIAESFQRYLGPLSPFRVPSYNKTEIVQFPHKPKITQYEITVRSIRRLGHRARVVPTRSSIYSMPGKMRRWRLINPKPRRR